MMTEGSDTVVNFSKEAVFQQLEKICTSIEMRSKSLLCKLLRFLVNETMEGRADKLKGYTIGVEVFHKKPGFDADQNPLVRIHAGRLRRMLRLYYLENGKYDPIRIEIPKGKYVPYFYNNAQSPERDGQSQVYHKNSKIKPSLVILPFKNHSGDPAKDYFSLGFSEELSVKLIRYEDLSVYESISFFKEILSDTEKHEFVSKKGIRFIVEGGVQLTDDQIKVLVRLTDLVKREQIWARRFLSDLTSLSLMDIQENIINEIAQIIGSEYGIVLQSLSNDSIHHTPESLDTFHAISRFYYFEAQQTPEASKEAFDALERAIQGNPDSGIAHAMLASIYGNRYTLDLEDADQALLKVNELSEKAIKLDPNSSIVQVIHAWKFFLNNDKGNFLHEVEKCLATNLLPSSRLGALGFYLCLYGEWDRGKVILDEVMHSNISFQLYFYGATTLFYYRKKEYERALAEALKYGIPALFWGPLLRAAVLGQLNKNSEAEPNIAHVKLLKPEFESNAQHLISLWVKENELVEHILDGLRKAGMAV